MKRIDEIGNREPFRVPDDYFETLSDRIMNNVQKKEISLPVEKTGKTIIMRLRPMLYLAAAICGIAVISYSVYKFSHGNTINATSQSVIADAMIEEIDTYTLENEIISSTQAKTIDNNSFSESLMLENIDETDITTDNK
jgi:hypothetical protein